MRKRVAGLTPLTLQSKAPKGLLEILEAKGYKIGASLAGGSRASAVRVVVRPGQRSKQAVVKSAEDPEVALHLTREYNILKLVGSHSNIVQAWAWHSSPKECGLEMSFHEGLTLRHFLPTLRCDAIPLRSHQIATQLLDAVAYLHSKGVVHEDLHSNNIIVEQIEVTQSVHAVLIDFGSATMVNSGGDVPDEDIVYCDPHSPASSFGPASRLGFASSASWETVRTDSGYFGGECTAPFILPPGWGPDGMGDSFQREAFATGLLICALARGHDTTTDDVFNYGALKADWCDPAPPMCTELQSLVLGLIDPLPSRRMLLEEAAMLLPKPECWFRRAAQQASEAVAALCGCTFEV